MSSSYWESTQRKFWTFTKQDLALERKRMEDAERNLVNLYPLPDRRHLSIYFSHRKSGAAELSPRLIQDRAVENGKATRRPATGPGYGAGLCAALLHQSRDPKDESGAGAGHSLVPGLQDGGMPTAH